MNRREWILALTSGGAAALSPAIVACLEAQELSPAHIEALLRELHRLTPGPGEAAAVLERLRSLRFEADPQPLVQPALGFNPEVEL
jgi:hypothetical protein